MNRPKHLTERAKRLRQDATWPEKLLWSDLRGRRVGGFKFRRQYSVLGHVLDFTCVEMKVGIEIDGASHVERERADDRKELVLRDNGWVIVRFSNREINTNGSGVVQHILNVCNLRMSEEDT